MTLIAVGISHARVAAAVDELLAAEDRYDVRRMRGSAVPSGAALAVVDAPFLERSARPLALPAVVIVGPDADRHALAARAPGARAWLRTSSTGDELLAAVDDVADAIAAEVAPMPPVLEAPPADAVADKPPEPAAPLGRVHEIALGALAVPLVAAMTAVVWTALR